MNAHGSKAAIEDETGFVHPGRIPALTEEMLGNDISRVSEEEEFLDKFVYEYMSTLTGPLPKFCSLKKFPKEKYSNKIKGFFIRKAK